MSKAYHNVTGRYVYKGIEWWMSRNGVSLKELAKRSEISYHTLQEILKGRTPSPGKYMIDRILEATGLTYEEAFRRSGVQNRRKA